MSTSEMGVFFGKQEKVKYNTVLSDHEFSFDPEFWGVYNTIAPESSLKEALKKIEKSIESSFEQDPMSPFSSPYMNDVP